MDTPETLGYYIDPFYHSWQQPKLHDGKFNTSVGCSLTRTHTFNTILPDPAEGSDYPNTNSDGLLEKIIVITPGLRQSALMYSIESADPFPKDEDVINTQIIQNHHVKTDDFGKWEVNLQDANRWDYKDGPNAWRILSQGVKIDTTSSPHETTGHYECISITPPNASSDIEGPQPGTETIHQDVRPNREWLKYHINNWGKHTNAKSYISGTLTDLNNRTLRQPVANSQHDPTELDTYYSINEMKWRMYDVFDKHFNWFILRLKVKPNMTFRFECQTNYEFTYPIGQGISLFETDGAGAVEADQLNEINDEIDEEAGPANVTPRQQLPRLRARIIPRITDTPARSSARTRSRNTQNTTTKRARRRIQL